MAVSRRYFDGFAINSFGNCINQLLDEQVTDKESASDTANCDVTDGNLSRVKGATLFSSVAGITSIAELIPYFHNDIADILASSGGSIYKVTTGTASLIGNGFTSSSFDYVNYQSAATELIILTNGVEPPKTYDNTSLVNLKNRMIVYNVDALGKVLATIQGYRDENGTIYATSDLCPSNAPICSLVELHKERIWMAQGQTVYCSTKYQPLDWMLPLDEVEANQHGGAINLPTWDGGKIIGLKSLFNDLVVFKSKSVHRIFGTDVSNFTVDQIFNTTNGTIIDRSICSKNNQAFWLSSEGIFIYDGVNVVDLSKRMIRIFRTINIAAINCSNAIMYKDKYILSVPTGISTVPNMIIEYDTVKQNINIRKGLTIVSMIEYNKQLLFTDGTNNIYLYNSGDTNVGTLISSNWLTPKLTFGYQEAIKNMYYIYVNAYGTGTIRFTASNEKGKIKTRDLLLTPTEKFYRVHLKMSGRVIQIKIENVNGCDFTIKQPQFIMDLDFD